MEMWVFSGRIRAGKLHVRRWKSFDGVRDCEVTITLEKRHAIRSIDANKYYWGVCLALISEYTGYTVDELHEWAKARFIPKHVAICDKNGEIKDDLVIGGTTTRLNRVQFYEYVQSIRQFASEKLDLNIPDPDRNWREKETAA